jgi:hypothetical protein
LGYGLPNALIKDLSVIHDNSEDIDPVYRYELEQKLDASGVGHEK